MSREERDIQNFIKRIQPSIRYFYRAAYAVTADRQMAEYVLGSALVDSYLRGTAPAGNLGFRDSILAVIREKALAQLKAEPGENEWDGLLAHPQNNDRLAELVLREPLETQRMIVLRYGCALTIREIGTLMSLDPGQVQDTLSRSRLHMERILNNEKLPSHPFDKLAMRAVRRLMNTESADQIDVSYLLHNFEMELSGRHRRRRVVLKTVRWLLLTLFALVCAVILWLIAVLMEM